MYKLLCRWQKQLKEGRINLGSGLKVQGVMTRRADPVVSPETSCLHLLGAGDYKVHTDHIVRKQGVMDAGTQSAFFFLFCLG